LADADDEITVVPPPSTLTLFPVLCSPDRVMFVTHYQASSWTPMVVIGLARCVRVT